jgi:hypothetical protein
MRFRENRQEGSTTRAARLRIHAALLTWATVLLLGATLLT